MNVKWSCSLWTEHCTGRRHMIFWSLGLYTLSLGAWSLGLITPLRNGNIIFGESNILLSITAETLKRWPGYLEKMYVLQLFYYSVTATALLPQIPSLCPGQAVAWPVKRGNPPPATSTGVPGPRPPTTPQLSPGCAASANEDRVIWTKGNYLLIKLWQIAKWPFLLQ